MMTKYYTQAELDILNNFHRLLYNTD